MVEIETGFPLRAFLGPGHSMYSTGFLKLFTTPRVPILGGCPSCLENSGVRSLPRLQWPQFHLHL